MSDNTTAHAAADYEREVAATIPFPSRFGLPEEFAALVLHMVGNPMLNGSVVRLDGALRMAAR